MADTDFDTKAAALVRRRKMADLLQQQSLEGFKPPPIQGRTSFLEPLGQMAKAFAGLHVGKEVDAAEAENEAARSAEYARLLAEMPKGTAATPGTPEIPAVPGETRAPMPSAGEQPLLKDILSPPAPTPQLSDFGVQPELPNLAPPQPAIPGTPGMPAKPPTGAEMLPWAAKIARTGQQGRDLAKFVEQRSMENMLPKALSEYEIADLASKAQTRTDTLAQRKEESLQRAQDRAEALAERARATDIASADRRQISADALAARREFHALAAGQNSEKNVPYSGVGDKGQRLVVSKNGELHEIGADGKVSAAAYGGAVTPQAVHEKNVLAIEKGKEGVADMQAIVDAVSGDDKIYGPRAQAASKLPNLFSWPAKASGLNPEQLAIRSNAAAMTAGITHSLYGSAFSAGEQQRAKGFLINEDDSSEDVKRKLKGRMKLEQDHIAGKPAAAQAAASARAPGAPAAAGGGDSAFDAAMQQYGKKR